MYAPDYSISLPRPRPSVKPEAEHARVIIRGVILYVDLSLCYEGVYIFCLSSLTFFNNISL